MSSLQARYGKTWKKDTNKVTRYESISWEEKSVSLDDWLFYKQKSLWDELSAYLMMSNCNCVKEYSLYKDQEAERVHQFLMGLVTSQFCVVRSNNWSITPLPNLNKFYSMVLREERQLSMTKVVDTKTTTEGVAFKASIANRPRQGGR